MTSRLFSAAGLKSWHPRRLPDLAAMAGRRARAGVGESQLLRQASHSVVVFNSRLYHSGNGAWADIAQLDSAGRPEPDALAEASASLLTRQSADDGIVVYLPASEFVATTVALPGVAREAVKAALRLQADTLLPGYDDELDLVVNPGRQPDAMEETALWLPVARLDALFAAFAARGLFLSAVMPRIVGLAASGTAAQIEDADACTLTRMQWQNGAIAEWQQISRLDLEDPAFAEQWQHSVETGYRPDLAQLRADSGEAFVGQLAPAMTAPAYCFIPRGAAEASQHHRRQKRIRMGAVAAAVVVLMALVPFVLQSVQSWRLDMALDRHYLAAAEARRHQQVVRDFENDWGVFTEYPTQAMNQVLFTLQEIISPNVLMSLELDEGRIQIEGESQDPQSLLQQLEAHPMFTQVDFARATSNNRYAIEMRLTTADFRNYYNWYFPEQRQP